MTNDEALPDVETTNWNAVKLLATKYGIQLRPLEEILASPSVTNSLNKKSNESQDVANIGRSDLRPEQVEDLGVGTPFMITARTVEGGRVIYRFKWRDRGAPEMSARKGSHEEALKNPNSETGYDPGSDSPSSSWGRKSGQRKQASSRTLKTKRSLPLLHTKLASSQNAASGSRSVSQNDQARIFSQAEKSKSPAPRIQRGDVLGAILGLREGITSQDYAWIDQGRDCKMPEKQKSPKGKSRDNASNSIPVTPSGLGSAWRSISPFGEPVLQKSQTTSFAQGNDWNKSPIPRLTDLNHPLFAEADDNVFHASHSSNTEEGNVNLPTACSDTLIYDVLQRYTLRGIESADEISNAKLSPISLPSRSRQASSSSDLVYSPSGLDDSFSLEATPGDDPRFALWAVRSGNEQDTLVLSGRDGSIELLPQSPYPHFGVTAPLKSSPGSPTSMKRLSQRMPNHASSSTEQFSSSGNFTPSQKATNPMLVPSDRAFLLAASIPCQIAELTSRIDNQLMTDFFYTYRVYLSGEELLRLLILRLRWAMASTSGPKEEARRKIVRVRTYVVIKYWLSNFFEIDFIPNRALRRQLTNWLNNPGSNEDMSINKSLKKIVRGLKKVYEQGGLGGILLSDASQSPEVLQGEGFRKDNNDIRPAQMEGSIDTLEWDEHVSDEKVAPIRNRSSVGVDTWRSPEVASPVQPFHHPPPPLPVTQSAISRAFVNTVGKLSRLKRNLNNRSTATPYLGGSSSGESSGLEGLELEANDSGDLLFIRGGVENFVKFFNLNSSEDDKSQRSEDELVSDSTTPQDETPSLSTASNQTFSTPASSIDLGNREESPDDTKQDNNSLDGLGISSEGADLRINSESDLTQANLAKTATADLLHHFQSDQTLRSISTVQPMETEQSPKSKSSKSSKSSNRRNILQSKGPDNIVQLDDIDSSSDEDDGMVRKALRRLPGARDLRMANHVRELEMPARNSMDSVSVSSFGRVYAASRRSIGSYYRGPNRESIDGLLWPPGNQLQMTTKTSPKIGIVETEMLDPDEALFGYELVKGFRLDQLEDSDEEEAGDVEAALRRLEGFIDQDKQKEKARKVEAMWLRSRAQRDEDEQREARESEEERIANRQSAPSIRQYQPSAQEQEVEMERQFLAPSLSPVKLEKKKKMQTAMPSIAARKLVPLSGGKGIVGRGAAAAPLSRLWAPPAPVHRSFLLNYRSEVIAQQFCLIESELFKAVTWRELVSDQWKKRQYTGQVLDWESFYQVSVRRKAEASDKGMDQVSNVEAIVARFNLTCNWVASEVVLTRHVDDRAAVICKLIRIAWKCYHHCNFATLTQIILGLQSPWVERLIKTWSRVGMLEMRMLRDLKAFINPARNFKHLRTAMKDMIVQGGMMELITSSGPPRSGYKAKQSQVRLSDGCIPFFGLFLSDLAVNDMLPTLIDPSSPDSSTLDYDASTGLLSTLADPLAFAHLPKLPETVKMYPLVNMYKYRNIAVTIKSVLAFQERLSSFEFEADANVYVKALRIRCLEGEQLTQVSHLVEP